MNFDRYSDDDLQAMAAEARRKAHDAPRCISGTNEAPYVSGDTWARRSNECMAIMDEIDRRKGIAASALDRSRSRSLYVLGTSQAAGTGCDHPHR